MESFDRIESFIDAGTWDSMDENMVSIDPYYPYEIEKIEKILHLLEMKTILQNL
jgi:acetyl-CoA carboxylase beta subunit